MHNCQCHVDTATAVWAPQFHEVVHSELKTLFFKKSFPDLSSSPYSIPPSPSRL